MSTYDIVFAGGGATACVVAGRLAAADPSLKILVLEAGQHTRDEDLHRQPARYPVHLQPGSDKVTVYRSKPSDAVGGRSLGVPCGHCVGGGSSVNFMMYNRAAASDFDDWEVAHKNPGWGSKDLLPLLKKTETYQIESNQPTHGYNGPLKVSYGGIYTNVGKQFLDVALQYDLERKETNDTNDLYHCNVYGRWAKWIDAETGTRSDVPHHYIYNQDHNKNLQVLDRRKVVRVIFNEVNLAVGVEYINESTVNKVIEVARSSKLVVISAGAFGSPAILERSGIGNKMILENHGIKQIVDLPGVGENYNDHNGCFIPYYASDDAETLDGIIQGDPAVVDRCLAEWERDGKGLMAHNGLDSGIKYRPSAAELKDMGPEFQRRWADFFANAPDKPVLYIGIISALIGNAPAELHRKTFTGCTYTMYPVSTGRVHITSGEDPHSPPDFEPCYLTHAADIAVLKFGYKKMREFVRRMPIFAGEMHPGHPTFSEGSKAAFGDVKPVDISAPDIVYSAEDEEALGSYVENFMQTTWHSLGTCAMKPREDGGVVDSRLNVYGTQGLKVADLSIPPSNVGANTYSTTLVIGEKAAVIIAEELGIRGV